MNSSTEIRLTRLCTQRCRQCQIYERTTDPPSMDLNRFRIVAARLRQYGAHVGFISGGEPTLVNDLEPILIEAKKTFSLATTLVTGLYNNTKIIRKVAKVCLANDINIQTSLDGLGDIGDQLRGAPNFADTVLRHMEIISNMRGSSRSLLYANIVMTDLNLEQIPELIAHVRKLGWRATIGLYHHSTETTRIDDELMVKPGPRLDEIIEILDHNPDILNLNTFIMGIKPYLSTGKTTPCPFVASRILTTRTTIMENGDVHLCWGGPIGNIYDHSLEEILTGSEYQKRLRQYKNCRGCWTVCYTQRYLLSHPGSIRNAYENVKKLQQLRGMLKEAKK
ncbi:radical SAM protein [candidate division KSB1 bacterium]|nr:radical SAM protein [candidate division KSB1 bacterium]